jgi:hypothetical protein
MNISARFLALALIAVPAVPALAATPAVAAPKAGPVLVARYTFDGGVVAGKVAENSGRGVALTVRSANRGTIRFPALAAGKYAGLPTRCAKTVTACPSALLQGADDPDLDPGTRRFTWAASLRVAKTQLAGSANVVQKGVATTESQWKLQVGLKNGKAQCVVVGRGSAKAYVARSSVGVADGAWHKVVCVRSGALLSVSVDGAVKGSVAIPAAMSILNDKPLRIGGPNFHTTSDMFHGDVDDVYAQLG